MAIAYTPALMRNPGALGLDAMDELPVLKQPVTRMTSRDRRSRGIAVARTRRSAFELLLSPAQALAALHRLDQLGRQLVAAGLAVLRVLGRVDCAGLSEDHSSCSRSHAMKSCAMSASSSTPRTRRLQPQSPEPSDPQSSLSR
jgi:hypothetical protein